MIKLLFGKIRNLSDKTDWFLSFKNYYENLPINWSLTRLSLLSIVKGGKRIPAGLKTSETASEHKYLRVTDMKNGTIISCAYIDDNVYESIKQYKIYDGDIYITVAGSIGNVGIVPPEYDNSNLTENADRIIVTKHINKQWFYYILRSNFIQTQIRESTTKVGQPKLAIKKILSLQIAVPPMKEQGKIVNKLEKLLNIVEQRFQ